MTLYITVSIAIDYNILCTYQVEAGVVGNIYSTDIMAYVDSVPIQSYNIGGKTAIVLEDLREYGFEVEWWQDIRKLIVVFEKKYDDTPTISNKNQITRGTQGKIVGKIYSTDIVAVVNGFEIPSYNIGGKTVACIEDLGNIDAEDNQNKPFGYSKYAMNFSWDGVNRTVSLNTFKDNRDELAELCKQYNITLPVDSNVYEPIFKYLDSDDFYFKMYYSYMNGKEYTNRIEDYYKITLNGKEIISDTPLTLIVHISDNTNSIDPTNLTRLNYDIEKIKNIFEEESLKNPFVPLTKEDIVKGLEKDSHIDILNRADIDNCIYLLCLFSGIMDGSYKVVKIDNDMNIYIYIKGKAFYDSNDHYQEVYYTDEYIRVNYEYYIEKNEDEKINLYYLDFNTKEVHQIYSDYGIQVSYYYYDNNLGTDIIKIQNNEGEAIELKLNELLK